MILTPEYNCVYTFRLKSVCIYVFSTLNSVHVKKLKTQNVNFVFTSNLYLQLRVNKVNLPNTAEKNNYLCRMLDKCHVFWHNSVNVLLLDSFDRFVLLFQFTFYFLFISTVIQNVRRTLVGMWSVSLKYWTLRA